MKILFTIALALSISLSSFAGPNSKLSQLSGVSYAYDKAKITLLEGAGKVKVSLLDHTGKKLYSQAVNVKENLTIPLDLAQVPYGTYIVRIENKDGKIDRVIETKKKPAKKSSFRAILKGSNHDNSIKLSVYEMEEPGMTLRVMDNQNKVLHKEIIEEGEPFVRRYLLSHIDKSQVYISLTDKKGNRQYFDIAS
jgi:hypothetical protein